MAEDVNRSEDKSSAASEADSDGDTNWSRTASPSVGVVSVSEVGSSVASCPINFVPKVSEEIVLLNAD